MLDFDYLLGFIANPFKIIGFGAIATAIIAAVPKCLSYYFDYRKTVHKDDLDYQKTIHTNNTQLEIERLKAKSKMKKPKLPKMRIDKGSS